MDVVLLSRIQFGLNIAVHYLFPPLSIGLSLMIVIIEGLYVRTQNPKYREMAQFWIKLFALTFALGVASGIVQVFAFGNNWARYSRFVGNVFGSALAAEGIFAFFLEAGFLGIMLFGWQRVSRGVHYLSSILVSFGAHFSAIWIVIANSWMQTPAGYRIEGTGVQAKAIVTDFWAMIFNPSSLDRLVHVILGCWLAGAFMVISVSAFYLLRQRYRDFAVTSLRLGLIVATLAVALQGWSADSTARGVAVNQPEKLAAIEGVYQTVPRTPMTLIGYVDTEKEKVIGIKIPALLSLLSYHNLTQAVPGLKTFPKRDWPNTAVVFQTYHIMIYMWILMGIAVILGWIFFAKRALERQRWLLAYLMVSVLFPYIANEAGWFTAEMGRQPWIVYHVLRTSEGVSPSIHAHQVMGSIIMFICIWSLLIALFIFLMDRKIRGGPRKELNELYSDPYLEFK